MATLQEYMARRDLSRRSGVYGTSASAGSQGKYWWIREREDEDVLTAARRAGLYGNDLKQQAQPQKSDAGFFERSFETGVDVIGNILSGAAKSLEGIFDLGLGAIGAVGGIFDKGVRDEMRRLVEYDWTGENISKHFDRWSDDSYMNGSRAGRIAEGVFSGVGQLLPTVAISVATGGTALPGMVAVGAGAAGNATEEAFNDGADYYRGLGYGVVSGGVEMATEKLFGGLGGLMGGGMLDNVTRSIAKTGAARVAKEMVGEAAEEALAEVVNPLARTIYKGRDALSDYGRADYWGGVGEAALVGGLTSAAYGGTVGRALKTSGKYADVQAVKDEIEAIGKKRSNLYINDKLTDAQEDALQKSEVANYRVLERLLQRSSDKKRADLIKRGNLSEAFDESGTLRTDFLRSLGERVVDGETDTPDANGAQGAKSAAVDRRYVTPGLFYQQEKIGKDISKINERRRNYTDGANAAEVRLFNGELSEQGKQNYKQAKRIFSSLSGKSGGKLQMAVLDSAAGTLGINMGDTVYISASTLEDGRYIKTMIEEVTHFAQGTEEHGRLERFLGENEDLLEEAERELLSEGNPYGFTEENVLHDGARAEEYNNELTAHMAAKLLDDKTYINRLVRQDSSLAEKIMGRLSDMGSAIARLTEKSAQQQYRRVKQASQMFEDAVTSAGWRYVNGRIEKEDEKEYYSLNQFEDGQRFVIVETDQSQFDGLTQKEKTDLATKIIKERFQGKAIGIDNRAFVNGVTVDEYTHPAKHIDNDIYEAKMHASTELDNLMDAGYNFRNDPDGKDGHVHKDATGGFDYYDVIFKVGNDYFKGVINVKNNSRGKLLKDITKIENITQDMTSQYGENPTYAFLRDASMNSIAQNSEKSSDVGGFSLEKVGEGANQQTADDLETASGKQFVKKSLSDVTGELMRSAGMVRGKNELMSKLESLYRFIASPGEKSGEAIGERASEIADWMVSKGALDAGENRENAVRTLAGEIYDQYWNVSEKISSQERMAIARAAARMDYKEKLDLVSADKRVLKEMVKALSSRVEQERKRAERAEAKAKSKDQDARESRKMTAEAQKATTAMRHDKEAAERKLETAKKRNEFLVERNDALREDARESRKMVIEEKIKRAESEKRKILYDDIKKTVENINNLKQGHFKATSVYKSDIYRSSIESLAKIDYRKIMNDNVRNIIAKLGEWYQPGNPLFNGDLHFEQSIYDAIVEISQDVGELSVNETISLKNIIDHMWFIEKNFGMVKKGDKWVKAEPIAKKQIEGIKNARVNRTSVTNFILNRNFKTDTKGRGVAARYFMEYGEPMLLARTFDSFDEEGFYSGTMEEWRDAAKQMDVDKLNWLQPFKEFYDNHKGFEKKLAKQTVTYRGQDIPLDIATGLYMTLKTPKSQRAAVESYYTWLKENGDKSDAEGFSPRVTGAKGRLSDWELAQICKKEYQKLWELFDEETKDYIKMQESIYAKTRKIKQDTDIANKGHSWVRDEGYYYPTIKDETATDIKLKHFSVDKVGHQSIDKHVVQGSNAGLLIAPSSSVLRHHIGQLALDKNFFIPMENFNRLVNIDTGNNAKNPTTIQRALDQHEDTREMLKYMKELAVDIQGGKVEARRGSFEDLGRIALSHYAKFQLAANPKTMAMQTTALIAAGNVLDAGCIAKGMVRGFSKGFGDLVDRNCPTAAVRNSENTVAMAQGALEVTNKIGDSLMKGIGATDRMCIRILYAACQNQIAKDQKIPVGTEENNALAGKLLEKVIFETQQNSIPTERTAAMRSKNGFVRALVLFTSDAMKMAGRLLESIGRYSVVHKKWRSAEGNVKIGLEAELKKARKQLIKSVSSATTSAAVSALIALAFRALYAKDDEKEPEEIAAEVTLDTVGNLFGGFPILRDVYSFFAEGYDVDIYMISTINDLLNSVSSTADIAGDIIAGKEMTSQEVARSIRDMMYSAGLLLGVPVRNINNMVTGLSSRFSDQAKYWNKNLYSKQSYASDLQKAIEVEDEGMVSLIASMMIEDKVGNVDAKVSAGLRELVEKGYDVLPRVLGDSIVYDGEEIELTRCQRERFKAVYAIAQEQIGSMMQLRQYKEASEEVRAKAVKLIWEAYWDLAVDDVLGVDSSEKNVLFAEAIDMDKLALIVATAREIKADYTGEGKAISGTRLAKIEAYIESLRLKAAQKYMIMGYLGYKNKNGEDKVRAYIDGLSKLSPAEKEKLMEYAGYNG